MGTAAGRNRLRGGGRLPVRIVTVSAWVWYPLQSPIRRLPLTSSHERAMHTCDSYDGCAISSLSRPSFNHILSFVFPGKSLILDTWTLNPPRRCSLSTSFRQHSGCQASLHRQSNNHRQTVAADNYVLLLPQPALRFKFQAIRAAFRQDHSGSNLHEHPSVHTVTLPSHSGSLILSATQSSTANCHHGWTPYAARLPSAGCHQHQPRVLPAPGRGGEDRHAGLCSACSSLLTVPLPG